MTKQCIVAVIQDVDEAGEQLAVRIEGNIGTHTGALAVLSAGLSLISQKLTEQAADEAKDADDASNRKPKLWTPGSPLSN